MTITDNEVLEQAASEGLDFKSIMGAFYASKTDSKLHSLRCGLTSVVDDVIVRHSLAEALNDPVKFHGECLGIVRFDKFKLCVLINKIRGILEMPATEQTLDGFVSYQDVKIAALSLSRESLTNIKPQSPTLAEWAKSKLSSFKVAQLVEVTLDKFQEEFLDDLVRNSIPEGALKGLKLDAFQGVREAMQENLVAKSRNVNGSIVMSLNRNAIHDVPLFIRSALAGILGEGRPFTVGLRQYPMRIAPWLVGHFSSSDFYELEEPLTPGQLETAQALHLESASGFGVQAGPYSSVKNAVFAALAV